jgi:4,5-DOPA dioxygenase extradiol
MTHCFTVFRQPELAGHNAAFDEWATDAITRGDVDALIDFRHKALGVEVAHKTPDHFVPLLLAMGASTTTGKSAVSGVDGMWFGNSIRSPQMS